MAIDWIGYDCKNCSVSPNSVHTEGSYGKC